jgi:hypothetical protein
MKTIKLNHWLVNNNSMAISLMNFYVNIDIISDEKNIYFAMRIYAADKNQVMFVFRSLEESISFVETYVSKCMKLSEITEVYDELYKQKSLKKKKNV